MRMMQILFSSVLAMAMTACTSTPSGDPNDAGTGDAAAAGMPAPTPAPSGSVAGQRSLADGATTTLRQGESVTLADGSSLRYVRVSEDSRCKPGHQCIRAGEARVEFTWTPVNGSAQTFLLQTPDRKPYSHQLGGREVTLTGLDFSEPAVATIGIDKR